MYKFSLPWQPSVDSSSLWCVMSRESSSRCFEGYQRAFSGRSIPKERTTW